MLQLKGNAAGSLSKAPRHHHYCATLAIVRFYYHKTHIQSLEMKVHKNTLMMPLVHVVCLKRPRNPTCCQ